MFYRICLLITHEVETISFKSNENVEQNSDFFKIRKLRFIFFFVKIDKLKRIKADKKYINLVHHIVMTHISNDLPFFYFNSYFYNVYIIYI